VHLRLVYSFIMVRFPENTLICAPMAEISHGAFRFLINTYGGCDLYFTEMISAGGYAAGSQFEDSYVQPVPSPEKLIIQTAGGESEIIRKAAEKLSRLPCAGIDINMGCSVAEFYRRGWGAAWMKDREKAGKLIRDLRGVLKDKSLSAKVRIGEQEDPEYLVRFCRTLEEEGLDFITLNPRTRKTRLSRPGDWSFVALLKKELHIPVAGNGDITDYQSFCRRKEASGADGFMIGRGAVWSPWIFHSIKEKLRNPYFREEISLPEAAETFLQAVPGFLPEDFLLSRTKKFFFYFSRNLKFGTQVYNSILQAESLEKIRSLIMGYFERNPGEVLRKT